MQVFRNSRWDLEWPPSQHPIAKMRNVIEQVIHEYRISSYDAFSFNIQVMPVAGPGTGDDYNYKAFYGIGFVGTQLFNFRQYGDSSQLPKLVRINRNGEVEISSFRGYNRTSSWELLSTYIRMLPTLSSPNRITHLHEYDLIKCRLAHQMEWWDANGKSFDFLKLPAELRISIYEYLIGSVIEPYLASKDRSRLNLYAKSFTYTSLLFLNKQAYREMHPQIYNSTTFHIVRTSLLARTLIHNLDFPLQQLRRLTLSMQHIEYFKLFGLTMLNTDSDEEDDEPEPFYRPSSVRDTLTQLRLDKLELIMPEPAYLTRLALLEPLCQKKTIDAILDAAWPYLRGQPVTLGGYVKDDQKKTFEAKAAAAHAQRKKLQAAGINDDDLDANANEAGGVLLDGSGSVDGADITAGPAPAEEKGPEWETDRYGEVVVKMDLPILCECNTDCLTNWTHHNKTVEVG